jgi:5'-deoxynucleotidase YfbR-like HD superfamily hydrolase
MAGTQETGTGGELIAKLAAMHRRAATLKRTIRRGWERRGVPAPESVADHMAGLGLLALIAARERGLSIERTLIMALIHELCEAITGDIIPADGIEPEEKRRRELAAVRQVLDEVDDSGELLELWMDFELGRTQEGKLVKELDRLEMAMQAGEYERETGLDLSEFHESARESLTSPDLIEVLAALRRA